MIDIGRVCVKIAGRDAGRKCVVIDIIDNNYVMIDGEARRRKANILHLEPLKETLKVEKGASHEEVASAFKEIGVEVITTKPKKAAPAPCKVRKKKEKPAKRDSKKRLDEKVVVAAKPKTAIAAEEKPIAAVA